MTDLASVEDVADLLGLDSSGLNEAQAAAMLAQASAKFRAEALCDFDATTSTVILRVTGASVSLPKRPVTEVTSVNAVNSDGTVGTALVGWLFDGISTISVDDQLWVINGPNLSRTDTVEVTWDHGFATVPEDVRWAVASMAARAISSPAPAGVTGETIGAYSYRTGMGTASFAASMTPDEVKIAHRYRPHISTMTSVL